VRSSIIPKRPQKFSAHVFLAAVIILLGTTVSSATRGQAGPPDAQTGVSVEASQQIFSVMCALDAAGFAGIKDRLFSRISQLTNFGFMGAAIAEVGAAAGLRVRLRRFRKSHHLIPADPGDDRSGVCSRRRCVKSARVGLLRV